MPAVVQVQLQQNLLVLKFGALDIVVSEDILLNLYHRRRAAGTPSSRPNSSRAAGAGGSSNTMLKLYTDDSPGLRVLVPEFYLVLVLIHSNVNSSDPFIVLVLSLSFIGSIFFLHISAKVIRAFTK
jgi:protein transport protein SEC61 subunit beta